MRLRQGANAALPSKALEDEKLRVFVGPLQRVRPRNGILAMVLLLLLLLDLLLDLVLDHLGLSS